MASSNLGRVQGGGFYGSTSTNTTSIATDTVKVDKVKPLVGDTIVNANGDLLQVTAVDTSAYTVSKYGSIKGATGSSGKSGLFKYRHHVKLEAWFNKNYPTTIFFNIDTLEQDKIDSKQAMLLQFQQYVKVIAKYNPEISSTDIFWPVISSQMIGDDTITREQEGFVYCMLLQSITTSKPTIRFRASADNSYLPQPDATLSTYVDIVEPL